MDQPVSPLDFTTSRYIIQQRNKTCLSRKLIPNVKRCIVWQPEKWNSPHLTYHNNNRIIHILVKKLVRPVKRSSALNPEVKLISSSHVTGGSVGADFDIFPNKAF